VLVKPYWRVDLENVGHDYLVFAEKVIKLKGASERARHQVDCQIVEPLVVFVVDKTIGKDT
jgi:hypothetical protein